MRRQKSDAPAPPRATPAELLLLLVPPAQAVDLVALGKTADAVANATRALRKLRDDGLGHLTSDDILVALAELDLRSKGLAPELIHRLDAADAELATAEQTLAGARRARTRAREEILVALGYNEAPAFVETNTCADSPETSP